MEKIKIWNDRPSTKQLDRICESLENGDVILIPTDTLYGIACDALNPKAIARICGLKGLDPDKHHLSILCSDISMASEYARIDNSAFMLLRDLTPGPYTFLFRTTAKLPRAFKGRKTVGIRIPQNELCRKLAERLGHPLMTTSIEFEDDDHAIDPGLVAESYDGSIDLFVEGEEGEVTPSTVVDLTGEVPAIVREGKGVVPF